MFGMNTIILELILFLRGPLATIMIIHFRATLCCIPCLCWMSLNTMMVIRKVSSVVIVQKMMPPAWMETCWYCNHSVADPNYNVFGIMIIISVTLIISVLLPVFMTITMGPNLTTDTTQPDPTKPTHYNPTIWQPLNCQQELAPPLKPTTIPLSQTLGAQPTNISPSQPTNPLPCTSLPSTDKQTN